MRRTFGMQARLNRGSTLLVPAIACSASLMLAACADSPTSVASTNETPGTPTASFVTKPGAGAAAILGTLKTETYPTIALGTQARGRIQARGNTTNSPFDLTYLGGPVVTTATNWNIAVNCGGSESCWATGPLTPSTLLSDLNQSHLIQVDNQYLGEDAAGKFSVQQLSTDPGPFTGHTVQLTDIFNIVGSAVLQTGATGYTNIYHVFLPKGTDMCITANECYSPDNPNTFVFCAFHNSVDFAISPTETVHVLFSVEPYQFVGGCVLPTQTRVIDGTAGALSHEFTETITDPDGDAWVSLVTNNEIGDLCFGFRFPVRLNKTIYVVQEEYSNAIQDCTFGAGFNTDKL